MKRFTTPLLVLLLAVTTASAGLAAGPDTQPDTHPDTEEARFEGLLRAIDVAPTRLQLEQGFTDAKALLTAAATDNRRDDYTRLRALTMLSLYPDAPDVRATLEGLATHRHVEVRRMAVYTVARTFGNPGDAALVSLVEDAARDPEPAVAAHAVRGLRWVDHTSAKAALTRLARDGKGTIRTLANRTLERRARRLRK